MKKKFNLFFVVCGLLSLFSCEREVRVVHEIELAGDPGGEDRVGRIVLESRLENSRETLKTCDRTLEVLGPDQVEKRAEVLAMRAHAQAEIREVEAELAGLK